MGDESEYCRLSYGLALDFEKLESREVCFEWAARNRIRGLCAQFLSAARMYHSAPPFSARESRSKARVIQKKAITAKKALSELCVCSYEAVLHDFNLFELEEGNAYLFSLKRAIRLVRKIAQAAERRSTEVHPGGRPDFWDFKHLVVELYRVFILCGGEGKIAWDKNRKCYKGYPLFFIRRVIDQVRPLVPEPVSKRFLPSKSSAVSRMAAEAVRAFEKKEAKNHPENRDKQTRFLPAAKFDSLLDMMIRCAHERRKNQSPVYQHQPD